MEEMVELFLPFFLFVSYICLRYTYWTNDWKIKMMKKRMRISQNSRFFTNFAKNTAHNERRLLNFSYLCSEVLSIVMRDSALQRASTWQAAGILWVCSARAFDACLSQSWTWKIQATDNSAITFTSLGVLYPIDIG